MKESVLVFTRYPEPGKTKTRLIPVLGAVAAAELHRQMAERTLTQLREMQAYRDISVEVYFTGSDRQMMQDWLGSSIIYQKQSEGDLGLRMAKALQRAIASGAEKVIIIGTDCPGLNSQLIAQAFDLLSQNQLVLGPALDGGYYLIGLLQFISELFTDINWGTAEVLKQTMDIANNLNLSVAYLPALADVDLPEDLSVWQQYEPHCNK